MRALRIVIVLFFALIFGFSSFDGYSVDQNDELPGVIPPSACRVGAVLSTEQFGGALPFMGPGRSTVLVGLPNDELVVGKWVVVNNFVPDTSVIGAPNCPAPLGAPFDGAGLNLMALRIRTTISSPQDADIRSITLVWDVNANGVYDPLLDLNLFKKPGSELLKPDGMLFHYGPAQPIATLSNTAGDCFGVNLPNSPPQVGNGPVDGTNSRNAPFGNNGCYFALLAIAEIGDSPKHHTKFGLDLKAYAGDIPGTTGISSFTFSSGFSSSRNPQASNTTVELFGGLPGPAGNAGTGTVYDNATNPENTFTELEFTGGQNGEGLLSRFRATEIGPGTREAIIYAGALCDGGPVAVTEVSILPAVTGAPPQIAGGLPAVPCIPAPNTDGIPAGIIAATLTFDVIDPFYNLIGTTRMYADIDCDGIFFEPGELIESQVPYHNGPTRDIYAFFNRRQDGPIFIPTTGAPLAGGCPAVGAPAGGDATPLPLILIWTVDINEDPHHTSQALTTARAQGFSVRAESNHFGLNGDVQITGTTPTTNGGSSSECIEDCQSICEGNEECLQDCLCFDCGIGGDCPEPESFEPDDITVSALNTVSSVIFSVYCQNVSFSQLEVYDLMGKAIYKSSHDRTMRFAWDLRDDQRRPVANGVYLYIVKAHRTDGEVVTSHVKKLVVKR